MEQPLFDLDTLVRTLADALGTVDPDDPDGSRRRARLRRAVEAVRFDAADPVPESTLAAARALGASLAARVGLVDRLRDAFALASEAVEAIVASVRFDSRLEPALAGLRGGTGFALALAADGIEVDLECEPTEGGRFVVVGQASGAGPAVVGVEWFEESDDGLRPGPRSVVDADGMFRATLEPGRHLLRLVRDAAPPIDSPPIDLP
jgi:hypothetical protein